MEYQPLTFGDCLSEWIRVKGFTVPELAALLGFESQSTLTHILRNQSTYESGARCLSALRSYGLLTREEHQSMAAMLGCAPCPAPPGSVMSVEYCASGLPDSTDPLSCGNGYVKIILERI